jgi:Domain of unknown function (DUF5655)/Domain of unknown function (DUF4287)
MDKALQTQIANIQKRTGKSLDELTALVRKAGLTKHGQAVAMLKDTLGMGHGDANTVVHLAFSSPASAGSAGSAEAELDRIYTGPKAALRPIHEAVMAAVDALGPFEIAPKKTYLSLRRKKQFAMVGPATNTRVEVGLNMKGIEGTARLEALPPGGMCQYKVKLTAPAEVDAELIGWIRTAYEAAN